MGAVDRIRNVISVTYGFTLEVMPLNFTVHHGTWRKNFVKKLNESTNGL